MDNFLTIEYAYSYGRTLQAARHLSAEERVHYKPEYADTVFIGVGDPIALNYVGIDDLPTRPADGSFNGCSNQAWKITQDEWDAFVALNDARRVEKAAKDRQARIVRLEQQKAAAEQQTDLPEKAEAHRREQKWNNLHNEGGEGYVPHIYSLEEYHEICRLLVTLKEEETAE